MADRNAPPPSKRPCNSTDHPLPVIIKLMDDRPNFKSMSLAEREAMRKAICTAIGDPRDSTVLPGGDLSVSPTDLQQQQLLLNIRTLAGRPASSTLPTRSTAGKVGVIFGIPINDAEEEILEALADQHVTHVKRLPIRNSPGSPSTTVLLTFLKEVPDRIKIASISYPVQVSVPSPYRCRNCWRLGHTANRCNANGPNCKRCGKQQHETHQECSRRCINCNSGDHEADNDQCPAYQQMKSIIKMAYLEEITIQEADPATQIYTAQ